MKASIIFALLSLYFANQISGQTVVTVNTATYFNDNVGGGATHSGGLNYNGPIFCRDATEYSTYGGPSQPACTTYGFTTPPLDQGRWGQSALGVSTQMSGLGFQGIVNQQVPAEQDFFLGQLTHFNWPIYAGTAASSINMNIFFQFTVAGSTTAQTFMFTFVMLVDETPNVAPCAYPGTTPCSDKISFNTSFNFATTFTIDNSGVQYTLALEGFKESNSSSSSAVTYFISNENENSQAFLFARITEACPSSCAPGSSYIVDANNDCSCDCSALSACSGNQTFAPNCTCVCPSTKTCANGGVVDTTKTSCPCVCSNTCPSPQVRNNDDCSCACPANSCHAGGTISNPTTCACACPTTACAISGETRNSTCDCVCNVQCSAPYTLSTQVGVCGCVCAGSCAAGYTRNQNNCSCQCTKTCVNSNLLSNCTCGPCTGNWTLDTSTGQCTKCNPNLASTCSAAGEVYNADSCACACTSLNCNLTLGTVVDTSKACACRNCTAGECICGNGRVEAGEQCDPGNNNDPCCQNCQFTTNPCNTSGSLCTENNYCNGAGQCNPGNYKCAAPTECNNITCDTNTGECLNNYIPDGSQCGDDNLCNSRCLTGVCDTTPVVCGADNNTNDCYHPACDSTTGVCGYVENNDTTSCSDGNLCTTNDACHSGTCVGQVLHCPAPDQCHNATCEYGVCVPYALVNHPCNADDNACTVGDVCAGGTCLPGSPIVCNVTGQCTGATCNSTTGICSSYVIPNYVNKTCNDNDVCTYMDTCVNGTCVGVKNPAYANATECGFLPIAGSAKTVKTTSIAIIAAIGAAALVGAIIGLAVLAKRIRANKLLNPDTWNPDMFSSVGSNPLYKGSSSAVDNALYEGAK